MSDDNTKPRKRHLRTTLWVLLVLYLVSAWPPIHVIGPTAFKVVDTATGKPIEGVAVVMSQNVKTILFGRDYYKLTRGEAVSDASGDVQFSLYAWPAAPLSLTMQGPSIYVFKKGYYPTGVHEYSPRVQDGEIMLTKVLSGDGEYAKYARSIDDFAMLLGRTCGSYSCWGDLTQTYLLLLDETVRLYEEGFNTGIYLWEPYSGI